jgi:hypothetical protein
MAIGTCPAHAAQPEPRIVGGSDVGSSGDFPYQVWVSNLDETQLCGGSILDSRHVATAAHCVVDLDGYPPAMLDPAGYKIGYGSNLLSGVSFVGVERIAVDHRYQRRLGENEFDSAVLDLAPPGIDLSGPNARAISLATPGQLGSAAQGTVTGWGATVGSDPSSVSNVLQRADIPLLADASCVSEYRASYVPAAMLCAGGNGKDTCFGDSGGPLVIDTGGGRRLAGITSFGEEPCGALGVPGVYTEVPEPGTAALLSSPPSVDPPAPPAALPTIRGALRVGSRVSCAAPPAPGGAPAQYSFWRETEPGLVRLAQQTGSSLVLPPATEGQRVRCDVRYENPAGFIYSALSDAAGPIERALPPPPPPRDTSAAVISRFSMTNRRFRVARHPTPRTARRARRGTAFTFRLSESAAVRISIYRAVPGRRSHQRCRRPTRSLRHRRRCTRYLLSGELVRRDRPHGSNRVAFSGRIGRRALRAGSYRATITATDRAGNRSRSRRTTFKVVRR